MCFRLEFAKSQYTFCPTGQIQVSQNKDDIWKEKLWEENNMEIMPFSWVTTEGTNAFD